MSQHFAEHMLSFLNNFLEVTVERPGLLVALRAQDHSLVYRPGLFWCISWVRGWVLSSQLRLSKAEILSVLNLQNSKSWWTRNLDIMNRPRLPLNNRPGSQGHILHMIFQNSCINKTFVAGLATKWIVFSMNPFISL